MIIELTGGRDDAIASRCGDFAIAAESASGCRDGCAGTLSYVTQGSESAHGSKLSIIQKSARLECLKSANVFIKPIWYPFRQQQLPFCNARSAGNSSLNVIGSALVQRARRIEQK
jgi:hypothetical protein